MPQNKENNMITQWFPSKSYNVQNSNKNKQQKNDNVSPSSSQQNIKSTNLPTNQKKKKWTHLEVLFGVWSMGFRVLKEPLFLIPFKGWMLFLPIESKERWSLRRCHWKCKKWRLGDRFQENGFVAKVVKNTKIWRDIEGNEWNQV